MSDGPQPLGRNHLPPTASANPKIARYRRFALAGMLLALVACFGGQWLLERAIRGPVQAARAETDRLRRDIKRYEDSLAKLRSAGKLLNQWEQQSLPTDTEVARSLYQAWLVELVNDVGLHTPSVSSSEPANHHGIYHTLSYSVRGRGNLEQLTKFLFALYQTDLLHQVRSLSITPLQKSDQLDLSLSVEAVALTAAASGRGRAAGRPASRETVFEEFRQRTWRVAHRLAFDSLESYDVIAQRNLFGMGGGADLADNTLLTSINLVEGQPEVWFTIRTKDEVVKLRVGQPLALGTLTLTVVEVLGSDVVVAVDGERWLLTLGDKVTDACALPSGL